jgi:monothiol glutaredoxin
MNEQELKTKIENAVKNNKIMLFVKGSKQMPQCGFSAATMQLFDSMKVPYETMDVLSDPNFRPVLKAYSNWPTFPQVFINGKLVGGADITRELYESGELKDMVSQALAG